MNVPLLNNPLVALVAFVVAVFIAAPAVRAGSLQQRVLFGVIFGAVIAGFARPLAGWVPVAGYYAAAVASLAIVLWSRADHRNDAKRWLARAARNPIVLAPPFAGTWRVAAGGPDPRHNHHQVVTDQYFAYDFLCEDGASWGQPILAPCDGMIAYVDDRHADAPPQQRRRDRRHPAGNYVSIETAGGYVILAHLQHGSIAVKSGLPVRAGDAIARCGNSGNTGGSHLHVHAQRSPYVDPNVAHGVPIAFRASDDAEPVLLEYGDELTRG